MTTTTDTYVIPSMRGEEYGAALHAEAAAEGHQAGMWHDETACGLPHSDREAYERRLAWQVRYMAAVERERRADMPGYLDNHAGM